MADLQTLKQLIANYPIIDNHAHNILQEKCACDYAKYPFESITSEAQDGSLQLHTPNSLAHLRAVKQLAEFYNCAPNWDAIKICRNEQTSRNYEGLVRRCLEGTHMLLLDDGLTAEDVEPYSWHNKFTSGPSKRIVRIETVAVQVIRNVLRAALSKTGGTTREFLLSADKQVIRGFWTTFSTRFREQIEDALNDPAVVGFKSVICYRTGLKVDNPSEDKVFSSFKAYFQYLVACGESRIENKPLNDYLLIVTLDRIARRTAETASSKASKPIQLHTGLGDSDINLRRSNPAYLQWLLEEYPTVNFVLLHSSYPYTREAGYLASIYENAYLDVGEVFPMTSRDAQISILRHSLELVPFSKLLWSTDGHFYPETYWLANKQFRHAMNVVSHNSNLQYLVIFSS